MDQNKFKITESEINRPVAYFAISLVWLSIIAVINVIVLLLYHLFEHGFSEYFAYRPDRFFIIVIAEILLIALSFFLIIHMIGVRKRYFRRVVVDEKGVYIYNYRNNIVGHTLYTELSLSNDPFTPDVSGKTNSQHSLTKSLRIFKKNKVGTIQETVIDFNFGFYTLKNKYELYRYFLQGVQACRPDLKISEYTLEDYHLTGEKKPVQKWGSFEFAITAVLAAIIFGLVYLFVLLIKFLSQV